MNFEDLIVDSRKELMMAYKFHNQNEESNRYPNLITNSTFPFGLPINQNSNLKRYRITHIECARKRTTRSIILPRA